MARRFHCFLTLWLASSLVAAQALPSIEVVLSTPTPKVRLDQALAIQVVVSNAERSRRVVLRGHPGFSEAGGVRVEFTDQQSVRTLLPTIPGRLSLSEAREGARVLVIEPGESIGMHRRLPVREVFQKPGIYTLKATYESPSPSANNPHVDRNAVEGARAESGELMIEVTE